MLKRVGGILVVCGIMSLIFLPPLWGGVVIAIGGVMIFL